MEKHRNIRIQQSKLEYTRTIDTKSDKNETLQPLKEVFCGCLKRGTNLGYMYICHNRRGQNCGKHGKTGDSNRSNSRNNDSNS